MKAKSKFARLTILVFTACTFFAYFFCTQIWPTFKPTKAIAVLFELCQVIHANTSTLDKSKLCQGIAGIEIALDGASIHPRIHNVVAGGAASEKGIAAGTFITKLDGRSTAAMSEPEWVKNLRGIAGTPLTITLSDQDRGGTEHDITVVRRPISTLTTKLEQFKMIENDGGSMDSYSSTMPAFLNNYNGMQILEFYDNKTGPSNVPPAFKNTQKCDSAKNSEEKGVLIRRFNIDEQVGLAIAKRLQIHSAPAYYFAPHGAWEPEPNRLETLPLLHKQYRPVCDHGVEAAPGQWTKIK